MLVMLDSCHSGGVGRPKDLEAVPLAGLSERTYSALAEGKGRAVIASSLPEERSWAIAGDRDSAFTGRVLEALYGEAHIAMADGYVRVFHVFRRVSQRVPAYVSQHTQPPAEQHPLFKAEIRLDFPIAIA